MNNRFKFRCYNKIQDKIFEVKSISYINGIVKRIEVQGEEKILIFDEWQKNIDNTILMQSTGLKDVNGKLIYEGDIVKIFHVSGTMEGRHFIDVVEWNKARCRFDTEIYGIFDDNDVYEVIGNVYENKELLDDD